VAERLNADRDPRALPRRLDEHGPGPALPAEFFLVACSLADLVRRFRRDNESWSSLPEKCAIQLNDTLRDGRRRIDADSAR